MLRNDRGARLAAVGDRNGCLESRDAVSKSGKRSASSGMPLHSSLSGAGMGAIGSPWHARFPMPIPVERGAVTSVSTCKSRVLGRCCKAQSKKARRSARPSSFFHGKKSSQPKRRARPPQKSRPVRMPSGAAIIRQPHWRMPFSLQHRSSLSGQVAAGKTMCACRAAAFKRDPK